MITATSTRPKRSASAIKDGAEKTDNKNKKKKIISNDIAATPSKEKPSKVSAKSTN